MGVKNLEKITGELMKNGMDKNTPAAVVHRASTPYQRVVEGTLETIYGIATEARITAPSLIVVGDVVTKREKLRFFDSKPLFGKNIVVTRSREQSSKMVAQIASSAAMLLSTRPSKSSRFRRMSTRWPRTLDLLTGTATLFLPAPTALKFSSTR
ncbi:hypothetical protein [Eubacterium callanderi]|uniref:hypothetical protein n=1 Tax=Eubacterium callanderi TaxID=53442 RepID=UPI00243373F3